MQTLGLVRCLGRFWPERLVCSRILEISAFSLAQTGGNGYVLFIVSKMQSANVRSATRFNLWDNWKWFIH